MQLAGEGQTHCQDQKADPVVSRTTFKVPASLVCSSTEGLICAPRSRDWSETEGGAQASSHLVGSTQHTPHPKLCSCQGWVGTKTRKPTLEFISQGLKYRDFNIRLLAEGVFCLFQVEFVHPLKSQASFLT